MTELIAPTTAQADSATFDVVAGTPVTIALKPAPGKEITSTMAAVIQRVTGGTDYMDVDEVDARPIQDRVKVIDAAGTYRVRKFSSDVAFGIDKI